jgi:hypothetical protein
MRQQQVAEVDAMPKGAVDVAEAAVCPSNEIHTITLPLPLWFCAEIEKKSPGLAAVVAVLDHPRTED